MVQRLLAFVLVSVSPGGVCTAVEPARDPLEPKPEAIEAWKDLRFGMFICWGPATWTGQRVRLNLLKTTEGPSIWEFSLFETETKQRQVAAALNVAAFLGSILEET